MPMGEGDILQGLIARTGQAQADRIMAALDPASAPLDCRTTGELLRVTRGLAAGVPFPVTDGVDGTWADFFALDGAELEALMAAGKTPPHLALLLAFAEVYAHPRAALNALTGRHLDHYYREVLRLLPRPAVPDRAHLVVELKKGAARVELNPTHRFGAGKDAMRRALVYAPVRTAVVGAAKVASLRSLHLDAAPHGLLRGAAVADSADGLGAPLPADEPAWSPFGHAGLPLAEVGFAIGSPALRLPAGNRRIVIRLALDAPLPALPAGTFAAFLTGGKGWLGPFEMGACAAGNVLCLPIELPASAPAIVDFDTGLHGYSGATGAPLLQCIFRGCAGTIGHDDVAAIGVRSATVEVEVADLPPRAIASDLGAGDPEKPFQPFGAEPTPGARFTVHCPDVLAQRLSALTLTMKWKDVPAALALHYAGYTDGRGTARVTGNGHFAVDVRFADGGGWNLSESAALFHTGDATAEHIMPFRRGAGAASGSESAAGPVAPAVASPRLHRGPTFARAALSRVAAYSLARDERIAMQRHRNFDVEPGAVTLRLNESFLHREYRAKFAAAVVAATKPNGTLALPAEPYTPTLESIRLAFAAQAGPAVLDVASEEALTGAEVAFYHVGCFGLRREHRYLRAISSAQPTARIPLFPEQPVAGAGALLIGLEGARPGDSVSLLFQVLPGSADPDAATPAVQWSVLCDDHWRAFAPGELALESTGNLLQSGIVQVQLPTDLHLDHRMMPAGLTWLCATTTSASDAVCRLLEVRANAVEVALVSEGNDPAHLSRPLPAGSIVQLLSTVASIKKIAQPYPGFGGAPPEQELPFRTRVSERLRHKDRAITIWDYERIVLDAFPCIHRVKCVPHTAADDRLAPGHVLLITVADLRNHHAADRLQPRVDAATLARVRQHVQQRAGQQVRIAVRNPRYERVRLSLQVRFVAGEDFNHRRLTLNDALLRALTPWAFDVEHGLRFGGTVYRSRLLQLVEELPYVDFVTGFRMSVVTAAGASADVHVARATTPDAVIVSEPEHAITRVP